MSEIKPAFKYFDPPAADVRTLELEGRTTKAISDAVRKQDFDRLVLREGDWRELDVLSELSTSLKELSIQSKHCDWTAISQLEGLEILQIGGWFRAPMAFERFVRLRELDVLWSNRYDDSIYELPRLEVLRIEGWPEQGCKKLGSLRNLKKLGLARASCESLTGISHLGSLEHIALFELRQLRDCNDIFKLPRLIELKIERCPAVNSYAFLSNIQGLRHLDILDSAPIVSLSPIDAMINLEVLRLGTTIVEDGDIRRLVGLPRLGMCLFKDRKNYNIKREELREILLPRREH